MSGDLGGSSFRALVAVAAALLAFTPAAFAGTVEPSLTPLPGLLPENPRAGGSTFQGGDGDQDDPVGQAGVVDWDGRQGLQPPLVHNPDTSAGNLAFTSGSAVEEPFAWTLTSEGAGVSPPKNDILDAWSAIEQPTPPPSIDALTFLYLAFTRKEGAGSAAVTFELNRRSDTWVNDNHARIPCRTTGDLLITATPGGTSADRVDIRLDEWRTSTVDSGSGCARTGTVNTLTMIPAGTAQGSMNISRTITSRLGGAYPVGAQISPRNFDEVALNLARLLQQPPFNRRCFAFTSVWMHSRSSPSLTSSMSDYVHPHALNLRRCSASGTKFFDLNANGVKDPDEPGLARFLIWADYDNDGVWDCAHPPSCSGPGDEPFAVTDSRGNYTIDGIDPPNGDEYRLRETLATDPSPSPASGWRCSRPAAGTPPDGFADGVGGRFHCGWGPINVARAPNVEGRDFGNWAPAYLTIDKRLFPAGSGTFDLMVNGRTVVPGAGDRSRITLRLRPGTFNVTEVAAAGTNQSEFRSAVSCRAMTSRSSIVRPGTAWNGLVLRAGDHATCTFANVRPGEPAILIEKRGPEVVQAGSTIRYKLDVTNPGDIPFLASNVKVTDTGCDRPPRLVSKHGDTSASTLDPGDKWTFACSHKTAPPGDDCVITARRNAANVSGTSLGRPVSDDDDILTTIECPEVPPEPPLPPTPEPPPGPDPLPGPPPGPTPPVVPPGPTPPIAGEGGVAGISTSRRRCITHVSQVRLTGQRMARITVSVNGRRLSARTLRLLQRNVIPLTRIFSPGRHRLTIRVTFERGSGTPSVTLSRVITVCGSARAAPRVTG
jgi:hypothetical protein